MGFKYIVSGYFGRSNLGDDLMLLSWHEKFKADHDDEYHVLLRGPSRYKFFPEELQSVPKDHFVFDMLHRLKLILVLKMKGYGKFMYLGGTQLSMSSSKATHIAILLEISLAKLLGLEILSFRAGIGNLENINSYLKLILRLHDRIEVRDTSSYRKLENLGFHSKTTLKRDLVYELKEDLKSEAARTTDDFEVIITGTGSVLRYNEQFLKSYLEFVQENYNANQKACFLVFQEGEDEFLAEILAKDYPKLELISLNLNDLPQISSIYLNSSKVVGMRFHSLVLADIFDIDFVGFSYDDKVKDLCTRKQKRFYSV